MAALFQIFGNNLDIVYPNELRTVESIGYQNVIYWNDTRLLSNLQPIQSPSPIQGLSGEQPTLLTLMQQLSYMLFYAIVAVIITAVTVVTIVLKLEKVPAKK